MKFLIIILLAFCLNSWGQVVSQQVPVGAVLPYMGNTAPHGFLKTDGSCASQTTYYSFSGDVELESRPTWAVNTP